MASSSRLIIQSDWDQVLTDLNEKAWVSFKTNTPPSVHGELHNQGLSAEGIPHVTGSDGFTVEQVTKKSITVTYTHESTSHSSTFLAPQTTYLAAHGGRKSVSCLDVSSGGLGVSADTNGKLRVWLSDTGEVRRELEGHVGDVYTCAFFPSGIVILSGGADMQLKIWSAETGKCATTITGHRAAILDCAIVDRGRNIVSCSKDGTAKLWDVGQQQCLGTFTDIGGIVNSCSIGVPTNTVNLQQPDVEPSEREVQTEGKLLLLGCENGTVQGYGLQSRKKVFELPCHDAVNCCCFVSDSSAVCGTQDGHITVMDLRNYRVPLKEWKDTRSAILSFAPFRSGFFTSTGDGSCFFVNGQWESVLELTGPDCDPVYSVSCDRTHIYTGCRDGIIRKYNSASADPVDVYTTDEIKKLLVVSACLPMLPDL